MTTPYNQEWDSWGDLEVELDLHEGGTVLTRNLRDLIISTKGLTIVRRLYKVITTTTATLKGYTMITTTEDNLDNHCEHCIWDGVAYWVGGEPIAQWIACDICDWGNQ